MTKQLCARYQSQTLLSLESCVLPTTIILRATGFNVDIKAMQEDVLQLIVKLTFYWFLK